MQVATEQQRKSFDCVSGVHGALHVMMFTVRQVHFALLFLQCFDSVGWVIWPVKTRPRYDL